MDKIKKFFSKKSTIIIMVVVFVLVAILAGGYIWLDSLVGKMGNLDDNNWTNSGTLEALEDETGTVSLEPDFEQTEDIFKGKDVVNILLVGQDKRNEETNQRSDAMILCTINQSTKTLTMTSFLRDVWVYIPDHYNQRLNKPYELGGFDLLNKTLDYNFGVSADYNVEIDFTGFMHAINLLGGLDLELTEAEAKYLNKRGNWDLESDNNWDLKEGVNHLNGSQALAYARIRQIGTDFARTNRQRIVLNALVEKAKGLDKLELYNLIVSILPMVNTDMNTPQVLGLMLKMLPMLSDLNVVSQRIPMDGQYSFQKKNGADVIVLSPKNLKANKELLTEAMKDGN